MFVGSTSSISGNSDCVIVTDDVKSKNKTSYESPQMTILIEFT